MSVVADSFGGSSMPGKKQGLAPPRI